MESDSDSKTEEDSSTEAIKTKNPQITQFEKNLLLTIVSRPEIKQIVENKRTNGVWKNKKDQTGAKVSTEFCSNVSVNPRTGDQLKKAWENFKSRAKKKLAKVKRGRRDTGGGAPVKDVSPFTERVVSAVPAQMKPLENNYDDDASCDEIDASSSDKRKPIVVQIDKKQEIFAAKPISVQVTKEFVEPNFKRKLVAGQEIIVQMEEVLQEKRVKLLDLQIQYEERRLQFLAEEHELKMSLLKRNGSEQ